MRDCTLEELSKEHHGLKDMANGQAEVMSEAYHKEMTLPRTKREWQIGFRHRPRHWLPNYNTMGKYENAKAMVI